MARSPLMRQLQRLVADHKLASTHNTPVEAIVEKRISRRAALKGVGAGAVGAVAALQLPVPARAVATNARIAVVGAGIAGLNAALTLRDSGVACTVYEANSRVGGRMFSESAFWANGQTSEWGGELIDREHQTMMRLVQRFGLATRDVIHAGPNGAEEVLHFDGTYYARSQADEDFKPVHQRLQSDQQAAPVATYNSASPAAIELDNMSVYDWIATRVPGGHSSKLGQFINVAYTVEYGADTPSQSALGLIYLMGYQTNPGHFNMWGLSDERYHIVGGNDQLPKAIAASLPSGTVRHGKELTALVANPNKTQTLRFADGTSVVADHTILAVPLGVLQRIDLSQARFDQRKLGSIAEMKMGNCTKLNLATSSRPWVGTGPWPGVSSGDAFTDLPFQQVWDATKGQPGTSGIMLQYGGGWLATVLQPPAPFLTSTASTYVANLARQRAFEIDQVFPGVLNAYTGKATLSAWHLNPYSYGAYCFWPVGYATRFAGYEGVRQGNIHFAGDHVSYDFQGWMNGAAIEGERAARDVLAAV